MKQVVINKHVRDMSKNYLTVLRKKNSVKDKTPEERLIDFESYLHRKRNLSKYANYVKEIIRLYSIIIRLEPEYYEQFHLRYFKSLTDNINLSMLIKYQETTKKFYEWVVDRMGYRDVRSSLLLPFMKKLNIKTCCYCNAQYATTFIDGVSSMASYEFDHYYPKSRYPYLSTSFFNLIPSCGCCNKHKGNISLDYPLYVSKNSSMLKFRIKPDSIIRYCITADAEMLEIDFTDGKDAPPGFASKYNKIFHISELYTAYVDEVEEILWKSRISNDSYRQQLQQSFNILFPCEPAKFSRFYYGFYTEESEILVRPLVKMKQDIAKQIDLI